MIKVAGVILNEQEINLNQDVCFDVCSSLSGAVTRPGFEHAATHNLGLWFLEIAAENCGYFIFLLFIPASYSLTCVFALISHVAFFVQTSTPHPMQEVLCYEHLPRLATRLALPYKK